MTPAKTLLRHRRLSGFTLLEMIAVLAIMAIIAAGLAPNTLRLIERAAVRAEGENLRMLGQQARQYQADTGLLLTAANWTTELVNRRYASAGVTDLLYNSRQSRLGAITRLYVPDPSATGYRGMLLSSMRPGIALPSVATIQAGFNTVWNTPDGTVPATAGWTSWNTGNIEYLVIERVNYLPPTVQFALRNQSAAVLSYRLLAPDGTVVTSGTIPAKAGSVDGTASPVGRPNQRLNLYTTSNFTGTIAYSYVAGQNGRTFVYDGTSWKLE